MTSFSPVHTIGNQIIEDDPLSREDDGKGSAPAGDRRPGSGRHPPAGATLDAYAHQLSGGLRQRAMIAMALSCDPRVLIADEPTTALDVTTQAQILDLLRRLQQQRGMAIILITHNLGVIAEMADDVAVMYLGRIVEQGPVDAIFHTPKHPYTQALLRSIPSIRSKPRHKLPTISGSIPHPYNRPPGCPFHPRCRSYMEGVCNVELPPSVLVGEKHEVSCFLYTDPAAAPQPATPNPAEPQAARRNQYRRKEGCEAWNIQYCRQYCNDQILLDISGLRKYFPIKKGFLRKVVGYVRAVDDVTFFISRGETLSLVGESGCGKTTTARCIMRAYPPTGGQMLFRSADGRNRTSPSSPSHRLRPLRREIQMIFQDPFSSLNPRMTLLDIVGEPLMVNGMGNAHERQDRVAELLQARRPAARVHAALSRTPSAAASASASASPAPWSSTPA